MEGVLENTSKAQTRVVGKGRIVLTLPVGPSLNKKYISRKFVLSKEYRDYARDVMWHCMSLNLTPLEGDLSMLIHWFRERKSGDIDSKIKCLLDSLQGFCYRDDSQISALQIIRHEDPQNPRMEVTIMQIDERV